MKRTLISLLTIAALLAVAIASEMQLAKIPREDPLGRKLLYLPSPEMLRLMSLGNPGLVADVLYLWSIQYYSLFEPHERFLYLETVSNLITDLDPLYVDAYRIGALIMEIQTGGDQAELKRAVRHLFDKGLRNMPDDWSLAESAAWDFFMRFGDRELALHYAEISAQRPDAPARIKRLVGVWRDEEGVWSVDDSIAYWRAAVADATDDYDRKMCLSKLYDAVFTRDRQKIDPLLAAHSQSSGSCADWGALIRAGLLDQAPLDFAGNGYGIDPEKCTLAAFKKIKDL